MVAFNIPTAWVAVQQCRTDFIRTWLGEGVAGQTALGATLFKASTRTATTTKRTRKKQFAPVDAAHFGASPVYSLLFFFFFFFRTHWKSWSRFQKRSTNLAPTLQLPSVKVLAVPCTARTSNFIGILSSIWKTVQFFLFIFFKLLVECFQTTLLKKPQQVFLPFQLLVIIMSN